MKKFMLLVAIAVSLYGNTSTGAKSSGLVGYWTFDGGNANDLTGNHNGTVVGSGVTFPAGKVGNAVNFSVGTSCIRIPSFNTDNITVEAWVYPTKYGYYTSMVTKSYYASSWSSPWAVWQLWLAENTAQPAIFSPQFGATSPDAISMSQWYHLAFTYDGTTSKLYVNGVEKASSTTSAGAITSTAGNVYIGKPEFANHSFTGSIDEVAIWDNALPGSDILKHYQNGLIGLGYLSAPTVQTDSVTNVTVSTATVTSEVVSENGSEVTARGVCWNTTGNPTTANFKTEDGTGTGEFTSTLTGLSAGTTYYVRAYSVNMIGASYGDEISFTTLNYFTDIGAGFTGVYDSSSSWGDFDNDGDLDLIITGDSGSGNLSSKIYRNDSGTFTDINAGLTGISYGSSEWGDYDNDGDLDLIIAGDTGSGRVTKIYRNDNGTFSEITTSIPGVNCSSVAWGDFDNDGDLDLFVSGYYSEEGHQAEGFAEIYRNDDGAFVAISSGITGVYNSSASWCDYDNDGDLDLLVTGNTGFAYTSRIYNNNSGVFTDIGAGLTGVERGRSVWGDYDNDGDMDILITGYTGSNGTAIVYRNNGNGTFTDIIAGLAGVESNSAAWGDYDNDGDLDILISGSGTSVIYRNDNGIFTDIGAGLTGTVSSSVSWADYDNDGDLDAFLSGLHVIGSFFEYEFVSKLFRNNSSVANTKPSAPSNLAYIQDQNGLHFSFDPATDAETPSAGLTYNIDIDIGDGTIKTASSDLTTGYKRVPSMGNIQQRTSWTLDIEAPPEMIPQQIFDMIWKVQAVDNCFAGSAFATKNDTVMTRDLITVPKETMVATDALTWEYYMPADSIAGYTLQFSGDSLFTDCFEIFMPKSKENKAVYIGIDLITLGVTDSLVNNERYFWRVKPEHVSSIENPTGFKKVPDSFIYDPIYSAPSPVSITVDGNYITLQWGTGKEAEKSMLYNIYSSDDPTAVFPEGWTLVNSVTGTSYVLNSSVKKKFYCVTAAGTVK
jgi:hypothetical protein